MSDKQQIADDLRAAAGLIEVHGWQQGMAENPDTGALCLLGAIGKACANCSDLAYAREGSSPRFDRAAFMVSHAVREVDPRRAHVSWLPGWNDDRSRTKEDVIAVLEKAAAKVEEQA